MIYHKQILVNTRYTLDLWARDRAGLKVIDNNGERAEETGRDGESLSPNPPTVSAFGFLRRVRRRCCKDRSEINYFESRPRALATYLADNILFGILSNKLMALLKRQGNAMPKT